MHEAKNDSRAELKKWLMWAKYMKPEDGYVVDEIYIRKAMAKWILREDLPVCVFRREDGRFIGSSGLHRMNWETRKFEIGYWVRSDEAGKGYATEVTTALCSYAFEAFNASRVSIIYSDGNEASRKVIEKVGFEKEEVLRKSDKLPGGEIVDKHLYAMLSPDALPELDVNWPGRG